MNEDALARLERSNRQLFGWFLFAWFQAVMWMTVALWALLG